MADSLHKIVKHTLSTGHHKSIHAGKYYTMVFVVRGGCHTEIDNKSIFCGTEDMILLKPKSSIVLYNKSTMYVFEYIVVSVAPSYLNELSDADTDMEFALNIIPEENVVSHLSSKNAMLIKNIALQLMGLYVNDPEFGDELFIKNLYSILILLVIRSCIESDSLVRKYRTKKLVLDEVFAYISNHLSEELTLDTLENEFYVSKYHLCREFKRLTGLTPHAYIVKARLNMCCKYIEQGLPITEVYQLGGFGGYNHFFRAFKKEYKMTPKEYYKNV